MWNFFTVPGPVLSLDTSAVNATAIIVSWGAPNTLGPLIDSYLLQYNTSCEGLVFSGSLTLGNQTLSVDLTDVEEASNYTISVTARNSVGNGKTVSTWHFTSATGVYK